MIKGDMMTPFTRRTLIAGAAGLGVSATVGCSSQAGSEQQQQGPVSITVSGKPPPSEQEGVALFTRRLQEFRAAHPDIAIEGVEEEWDAETFNAKLAGGTLPDTMTVPYTEPQALISRQQVTDLTDQLAELGIGDRLNPQTLPVVQDDRERIFGVPVVVYSMALNYNRALFEQAGLDPDRPPANWDELRQFAQQIADRTGVAGYVTGTTTNYGGFNLTAQTAAFGGTMETPDGTRTTFDSEPTKQVLRLLHQMRWEDNSLGRDFLYDQEKMAQNLAAGQIGMFIASNLYEQCVTTFEMPKEDFGLAVMPMGPGQTESRTLGGGAVTVVPATSAAGAALAAMRWVDFLEFSRFTSEEAAVADAKATAADGGAVGNVGLTPLNQAVYEQYQAWIEPYVNVPLENFTNYIENGPQQTLVPEPVNQAQELYAVLDTVVQTVLTEQDADIDALLAEAAATMDRNLSRRTR